MSAHAASVRFILITLVIDALGFGLVVPIVPSLVLKLSGLGVSGASGALYGVRALQACARAGVEVVIYSGRKQSSVFEAARLIHEHPRFEKTPIIFVTGVHVSEPVSAVEVAICVTRVGTPPTL